jgi:hypothetical protein
LIRAKKGETYHLGYYFSSHAIGSDLYYFERQFEVQAPAEGIAYVGDIVLDISIRGAGGSSGLQPGSTVKNVYGGRKSSIEDNESETIPQLKSRYPALFDRYSYQKMLAKQANHLATNEETRRTGGRMSLSPI